MRVIIQNDASVLGVALALASLAVLLYLLVRYSERAETMARTADSKLTDGHSGKDEADSRQEHQER